MLEEIKQVIVVRQDLEMGKGKLAVQVAHAAVEGYIEASKYKPEWVEEWLKQGQKKVIVKVSSLEELTNIFNEARKHKLPTCIIRDAGKTQLKPGTITCVALGPAPSRILDEITGKLKLL
ncbi:MAG: peptidyl-tRNA hydrolase [Thermoprotei archaeon]|nr:MAG: peptidyl-tRNA hydrolase [Thermoprotei archaeon]